MSVAEEHYITASVGALITRLHDRFIADNRRRAQRGKTVVVASVERDLHEIGIRMVADFFEMDRWDTYYIGPNTPALSLLRAARDRKADVIAISCTMPSFLPVGPLPDPVFTGRLRHGAGKDHRGGASFQGGSRTLETVGQMPVQRMQQTQSLLHTGLRDSCRSF